ncbi:hypothetical protein CfE428DRAFT_3365 [Chthoniobacter flavus Ellin428]|uniref:Uncharacterized protein n=1 Tax=Chthoniobacter flavus Ellin428 TaxID=497964 RepID=B4D377_9BACT|nr:hypothetical protein CfE428DRAFT_3365 [Chthoniobacter flavus Ellin428]
MLAANGCALAKLREGRHPLGGITYEHLVSYLGESRRR